MDKIFGQLTSPPPPPPKRNWSLVVRLWPHLKESNLKVTHNIAGVNCRYLQISGMSFFFLMAIIVNSNSSTQREGMNRHALYRKT